MSNPTSKERRTLETFFQCAAPQLGLYDRKLRTLRAGAEDEGIFKTNLELLRELVSKHKFDYSRIQELCRFCIREKRQVLWINEVIPEVTKDYESLDRNLLSPGEQPIHRLLTRVVLPVSRLSFGAGASVAEGEISVTKRESFTMDELVTFFSETFDINRTKDSDKAMIGAFNYLLAQYGLDAILFAIDFAADAEKAVRSPLGLQDTFLPQAQEHVDLRKARR